MLNFTIIMTSPLACIRFFLQVCAHNYVKLYYLKECSILPCVNHNYYVQLIQHYYLPLIVMQGYRLDLVLKASVRKELQGLCQVNTSLLCDGCQCQIRNEFYHHDFSAYILCQQFPYCQHFMLQLAIYSVQLYAKL